MAALRPSLLAVLAAAVVAVVGAVVVLPGAVVPIAGLIALATIAPLLRRLAAGAAWSLPVLVGIAVLLVDTGGRTLAPGVWRYGVTAVVVLTIVLLGTAPDERSRALRATALVLFAYGLIGTVYGRLVLDTTNGSLPLIGPLVIACLPPVRNWGPAPEWRLGLRGVAAACALFAVLSGLARMGLLPETHVDVLNHEKAFLLVLGIGAAIAARDRLLILITTGTAVFAFLQYAAATYVLAVVVALGTVVLTRWSPPGGIRAQLGVATMAVTAVAVLRIDDLIRVTGAYFSLVGKIDNGNTRDALYRSALAGFDSPLFGSFFTGDITVVGTLSGEQVVVPVHNDYLSVSLGGGLVAGGLLLGLFLFANGLVLRSLPSIGDPFQRRTVVAILCAVNAAAVSAFANPIFMNPGSSAVTYALLAALMAACRIPAPVVPSGDRGSRDNSQTEGSPGPLCRVGSTRRFP